MKAMQIAAIVVLVLGAVSVAQQEKGDYQERANDLKGRAQAAEDLRKIGKEMRELASEKDVTFPGIPASDIFLVAPMVECSNTFACALYARLAKQEGNLFFSPTSIHTALAMTFAGARQDTLAQMHMALRLPRDASVWNPKTGKELGVYVIPAGPTLPDATGIDIVGGRFITESDIASHKRCCLITQGLAENVFGRDSSLGKHLRLQGDVFEIVGVIGRLSGNGVIIPITTLHHTGVRWTQKWMHRAYGDLLSRLEPGKDAGYTLHVANALWGQKGDRWLPEFLKVTKDNYGAGLREVDFARATEAARKTINDWVEKQTAEKIKELLQKDDVDRLTALVLTNAIYFKGDWASKFDEKATRDGEFHVSAEEKVTVPMMHQTGRFGYAEMKDAKALKLPYAGDELSMVIFLPKKVDGLAAFEKTLTAEAISSWLKKLHKANVRVAMPRFKLKSRYYLKKPLKALGMVDAFSPKEADFSGMDGTRTLFISKVIHQAFVDVNEEGTEAAAATAVVMKKNNGGPGPKIFRADHPFLFLIRHEKTGVILFLGRVANPTE